MPAVPVCCRLVLCRGLPGMLLARGPLLLRLLLPLLYQGGPRQAKVAAEHRRGPRALGQSLQAMGVKWNRGGHEQG